MAKVNLYIDDELLDEMDNCIPPRLRSAVVRESASMAVQFIQEHGDAALSLILNGEVKLTANKPAQNLDTSNASKQ